MCYSSTASVSVVLCRYTIPYQKSRAESGSIFTRQKVSTPLNAQGRRVTLTGGLRQPFLPMTSRPPPPPPSSQLIDIWSVQISLRSSATCCFPRPIGTPYRPAGFAENRDPPARFSNKGRLDRPRRATKYVSNAVFQSSISDTNVGLTPLAYLILPCGAGRYSPFKVEHVHASSIRSNFFSSR